MKLSQLLVTGIFAVFGMTIYLMFLAHRDAELMHRYHPTIERTVEK
jgi:hypothetical protein